MKILQSCGSHSWGGLEMIAAQTAIKLQNLGYDIWFFCPPNSALSEFLTKAGIRTINQSTKNIRIIFSGKNLVKFLRKNKIDVVHTHLSHDLWTLIPAMKFSKLKPKIFLTKHMGSWVNKKDIFHKFLYKRLNGIFCVSNYVRDSVIATCPVQEEKTIILHNGVDIKKYSVYNTKLAKLRRELKINENVILISIIGRITPGKGHEEFISAANILLKERNDILFLIIGKCEDSERKYLQSLESKINKMNLNNKIHFVGHRENIQEILSEIDILAFPSHEESFGITLIEAMSAGIPVVASKNAGILDIIQDGYNGILIEPKSYISLAKGLLYIIDNPEKKIDFIANAKKTVEEKFNFDRIIFELQEYYRSL